MEPKTDQQYQDEYRTLLQEYAKQSQTDYDSTLITLSGGALGISFAFVNQFIGDEPIRYFALLLIAWVAWVLSLGTVLFSFYTSTRAMHKTIEALDAGQLFPKWVLLHYYVGSRATYKAVDEIGLQLPHSKRLGDRFDLATGWLNRLSGILFIVGVITMISFALFNISR